MINEVDIQLYLCVDKEDFIIEFYEFFKTNQYFKITLPEGAVIPLTESGTTWYQLIEKDTS